MKYFFLFFIPLLFSCTIRGKKEHNDTSSKNTETQNNFSLNKNNISPSISVHYNADRDIIVYVSIKNLNDSIPDSLYSYPIRGLFIEESSIKYRKDFFKQLEILSLIETELSEKLFIDSTFKDLKCVKVINPLSEITNSEIRLDKFEYWVEIYDIDIEKTIPFSFDLNKMRVDSSLYIISPLEEIIIPSNKNYKDILFCTKNEQFERLNAEYEIVDTLYCHKMRERQIRATEARDLRNERK
ncbi:hypothetical protein ACE193_21460 [Bernardetia sp. OM2101]|uniref:hypothetical protein n=1 Tax=Bernardetia sp. OM2101 TaxID=3344876 RepID=UPI0035CF9D03